MVTKLERENNTIFYLHNAWANSPDGTAGFTLEESEDAAYIGNCISMSSAEVLNPSSYNWIAVEFEAVEESDTAELTELGEDVPEDPEDEDDDYSYEDYMDGAVQSAADTATTAQESADIAQQKAEEATASAALAQQKAEEATAFAAEAKTAADTAREKAEAATTDAATAKQKAEEATSSAALAKQKAESATAAAETAHSAAQSATSDARTAGIAAATAQAAAEAAQGDIDDQKKYFYHDKLGAHVLDSAGGAYRTDIKSDGVQIVQTATETPIAKYGETSTIGATAGNHVTIAEKDVQIRNGKKVVASYGETIVLGAGEQRLEITKNGVVAKNEQNTLANFTSNGMQIGDLSGNNMEIKDNKVSIRSGVKETLAIESATTSHSVTTTYVFHGSEADSAMTAGEIYTESYILSNPVKINSAEITDESGRSKAYGGFYDVSIDGSQLVITIDASNSGASYTDWTEYTKCIVTYESGTVESTVKCNNIEASGTNGNMISYTKITSGTGKVKNTNGAVTAIYWSTCGCVATVRATFKATASVAAGKDMCTGTFTGIPKPVLGARGAGAYSKSPMIFGIGENGSYFARNCGTESIASGKTAQGILVYMTDGTFISETGGQPGGGA